MKLRYDPYQVFRFSKTPAGLYARQKWLAEAETPRWKIDFQETTVALWADQLPDGSWRHSPLTTIRHLFGLHLTIRESSAGIRAALNWLLDKINLRRNKIIVACEGDLTADSLKGLPFVAGRQDMLIVAAVLFMATIFGRGSDPAVLAFYHQNTDGTWGRSEPEWNTFLAIHALKNKGLM